VRPPFVVIAPEYTPRVKLAELAGLASALAATRSRLAKRDLAAAFLRRLASGEVADAVAFLTGRPFPASDDRVLDVSWATLRRMITDLPPAPESFDLELADVAAAFARVAAAAGPGSRAEKAAPLRALFTRATPAERELLTRLIHGEMRIGLHEGLVQEAIAAAAGVQPGLVRRAMLARADPAAVARLALEGGEAALRAAEVRVFQPLAPMLAEPVADVAAALAVHGGRTALEWKYDGARVQVHVADGAVRIWSRRLTEVTASLPDVVATVRALLPGGPVILDGEIVALGSDGKPLPFQDLMRRLTRVHGIARSVEAVPLALHLFDCVLRDGRPLLDEPYAARWTALEALTGGRHLARRLVTTEVAAAEAFLAEALAAGHEGLVTKALDSPYTPGSRGKAWLKVKLAETVDCVIVAADRGSGRRQGWLSNYHLAVRDGDGFAEVGKTFKGLTDAEFAAMTARLRALETADDGYTVTVRPEVVVEVAYNEIQWSPQYPSGLALRFARIVRIRDDKAPDQASTLAELRRLYDRQFTAKSRRPGAPS
jgi:DNA ligase-1